MNTNMQMGALLELNTEDPVDKAIMNLVKMELVECCYHDDTGELGVMLTEKAKKLIDEVNDPELDKYIDGDEFTKFLIKAEKVLDSLC